MAAAAAVVVAVAGAVNLTQLETTTTFGKVGGSPVKGGRCWSRGGPLGEPLSSQLLFLPCILRCDQDPDCFFMSFPAGECQLFYGTMLVGCQGQTSTGPDEYYKVQWNLALQRPVTASSTWPYHYVTFVNLTQYYANPTFTSYLYAACTNNAALQYATVDLGLTYDVSLVRVTLSRENQENIHFQTITVFVGDKGDTSDPVVASSPPMARTPLEMQLYPVSARGRYVTLQQTETTHLCMCNLEVFGKTGE